MRDTLGIILPQVGDNSDLRPLLGHRTIGTLPFGGRYRLIDFSLSNLVNSGITKVGIIGSHKYSSIVDHLGTGKEWLLSRKTNDLAILTGSVNRKLDVNYTINMLDFILNKNFIKNSPADKVVLTSSNLVTTFDFDEPAEVYNKNNADVVLIYRSDKESFKTIDTDVFLTLDGRRVSDLSFGEEGKTDHKYADMMIIKKEVLLKLIDIAELNEINDLFSLISENLDTLRVYGYKHEGYFNRVFDIQKYYEASIDLLNYDVLSQLFFTDRPVYTKTKDNHPTRYGEDANIKDCIVASGAYIDGTLEHSIVFRECEVEKDTDIKNSIIMQKCKIGKNVKLDHVIFDKEVTVRDNTELIGTYKNPIILEKGEEI